ncbi:MAG: hypothetical protein KBT66_02955, partial [Amphritea sp.]|nr:hypothetical protein [Amphritea sp.]
LVRTRGEEISVLGRNTQGVRVIRVAEDENLVGVARIEEPEESEDDLIEGEVVEGEEGEVASAPEPAADQASESSEDDIEE